MTNKIIRKILLLTAASVFVIGCDKENDPKADPCYLVTVSFAADDIAASQTFTYDKDKLIKIVSETVFPGGSKETIITPTYGANGNITELNDSDGGKTVYSYNTNSQVIKIEEFENAVLYERTEYEYSGEHLIKVQSHEETSPGIFVKGDYDVYEYASPSSNNLSRMKSYNSTGDLFSTVEYEFDDKKNPYTADRVLYRLLMVGGPNQNNVTKETYIIPGSTGTVSTNTIEYNDKGLPSKIDKRESGSTSITLTTEYTYTCK